MNILLRIPVISGILVPVLPTVPNVKATISSLANLDDGPLKTVFSDEKRLFLSWTAWPALEAFRSGQL